MRRGYQGVGDLRLRCSYNRPRNLLTMFEESAHCKAVRWEAGCQTHYTIQKTMGPTLEYSEAGKCLPFCEYF